MTPSYYIFNHVPKTGGTSLVTLFQHKLAGAEISPHILEHDVRTARTERLEHYRLIRGHFSVLSQSRFVRDRYSITLVRHPIRRIVSAYQFAQVFPHPTKDIATRKATILPFREYVRYFADSPLVIRNVLTHHFAAVPRDFPGVPDDEALLAAAKHNLASFNFVGITEELEPTIRVLCRELGWEPPVGPIRENTSGSERLLDRIDPVTMDILLNRNRLDLELYECARCAFSKRFERFCQGAPPESVREANRFIPFSVPYEPRRSASITEVRAECTYGGSRARLDVTIRFRIEETVADLVAGLSIRDAEGNEIYGTNTYVEAVELKRAPGCDSKATFLLDCDLPAGIYFVSAALHDVRPGLFHDWIDKATAFEVRSGYRTADPHGGIHFCDFRSKSWPTPG